MTNTIKSPDLVQYDLGCYKAPSGDPVVEINIFLPAAYKGNISAQVVQAICSKFVLLECPLCSIYYPNGLACPNCGLDTNNC